ncbi:MAG TPA: hypothetical protein VMI31_14590, partial [Fimbriimonadaceae bacterium]|nr:hypothetical protein [Fimbriimonadaceae bacterium]
MATRLKMKALLVGIALAPVLVSAQFLGGGDSGNPWDSFKLNPKTKISFNFQNASVDAVIRLLEQQSGVTIIKDPTLTKGITLISAKPRSLNDAFKDFQTTLGLMGYSLAKDGNSLVIRGQQQRGGGNGFPGGFDPSQLGQLMNSQQNPHLS